MRHRFSLQEGFSDQLRCIQDDLASYPRKLIALVLAQAAQIAELTRRIAELERAGGHQDPGHSSVPPSAGAQAQPGRAPRRRKTKGPSRPCFGSCAQSGPDRFELLQNTARTASTR